MNAKISWYKEVLEIEPQARLFYPLARLLAGEGRTEEACDYLAKGLGYHPDYMEARMFYAELLQKAGRGAESAAQIATLSGALAANPGFWQTWALNSANNADSALAVRCLALVLHNAPVSFTDIISRGLDSLEAEYGLRTRPVMSSASAAEEPAEATAKAREERQEEGLQTLNEALPGAAALEQMVGNLAEATMSDAAEPSVKDADTGADTYGASLPGAEDLARFVLDNEESADNAACGTDDGKDEAGAASEDAGLMSGEAAQAAVSAAGMEEESVDPISPRAVAGKRGLTRLNGSCEPSSWPPRTRSMAAVLVEQGYYAAAESIYKELLAGTTSRSGAAELRRCLEEIRRLSSGSAAGPETAAEAAAEPAGAEKIASEDVDKLRDVMTTGELVSFLDALASRVEARVH